MSIPYEYIETEKRKVKTITDQYKSKLLIIDHSFQRRYVWVEKDKIRLIETILLGYTIPELYFWETGTNPENGETVYSVIDGQQRLGALHDFIDNKFSLNEKLLDYRDVEYKNMYFKDLSDENKKRIWNYPFNVRFINEKVSKNEIKIMFDRLNSTSYSLSPQELRHAKYDGLFRNLAIDIADNKFWGDYGFFSGHQGRRMIDVEFMSQILMYFRFGLDMDTKQQNINETYKLYDKEYNEREEDKKNFLSLIDYLHLIIKVSEEDKHIISFLKKTTHLYPVLIVLAQLSIKYKKIPSKIIERFVMFINIYNKPESVTVETSEQELSLVDYYKNNAQDATSARQTRIERIKTLKEFVTLD